MLENTDLRIEKLCKDTNPNVKDQIATLARAIFAMEEKINQQIPIYEQMPLAQSVQVGTGQKMLRNNPATQEFRATVKDYAQALETLNDILAENTTQETSNVSTLESLRKNLKVI